MEDIATSLKTRDITSHLCENFILPTSYYAMH
jgi:hypothetical protein